jgi:hypothetical protein
MTSETFESFAMFFKPYHFSELYGNTIHDVSHELIYECFDYMIDEAEYNKYVEFYNNYRDYIIDKFIEIAGNRVMDEICTKNILRMFS